MLKDRGIEVPMEQTIRSQFCLDSGKRCLPYSKENVAEDLFPAETEQRLEFLTADEKVDELNQVVQDKEMEIQRLNQSPDDRTRELEEKLFNFEQENQALKASLENKSHKFEQLLKAPAPNQENRQQVAELFEKDIVSLGDNIIRQLDEKVEEYQPLHISQDITSMMKLVHVAFQAI